MFAKLGIVAAVAVAGAVIYGGASGMLSPALEALPAPLRDGAEGLGSGAADSLERGLDGPVGRAVNETGGRLSDAASGLDPLGQVTGILAGGG